ncbi:hypothetical protein Peur_035683 [Populus x canadensis]
MVLGLRMGMQNPILNCVFSLGFHWLVKFDFYKDDDSKGLVQVDLEMFPQLLAFVMRVIKVMHSTDIKDMNLGQGYMPEFARFWSFMLLTGRVSYLAMDWQHLEAVWTRRALWTQRASLNER